MPISTVSTFWDSNKLSALFHSLPSLFIFSNIIIFIFPSHHHLHLSSTCPPWLDSSVFPSLSKLFFATQQKTKFPLFLACFHLILCSMLHLPALMLTSRLYAGELYSIFSVSSFPSPQSWLHLKEGIIYHIMALIYNLFPIN